MLRNILLKNLWEEFDILRLLFNAHKTKRCPLSVTKGMHLPAVPKPDDTADALAMAITFCHTNGNQLNRYTRRVAGPI